MSMSSEHAGSIKADDKDMKGNDRSVELQTQDVDMKEESDGSQDAGGHHPQYTHADRAALATDELLQDAEMAKHLKSGTRKLDWMVVPALLLMWLANFVDRSNAGNARIAGLQMDLKLQGREFNTALAIFYVSYILVEIPSNLVLKKVGGNIWLPTITLLWGMITCCMAAVRNYSGFLAVRFFLGAAEGGLLGGISLYLSGIYPRFSIQQRIARFYSAAAIAGSFGGLLASGLTTLNTSGIRGWRWLYIVEGVITMGFALFAVAIMPRSVAKARFLNDDERRACLEALKRDHSTQTRTAVITTGGFTNGNSEKTTHAQDAEQAELDAKVDDEAFDWYEVKRGMTDIQTWLTGILYLCVCTSLYSITLFLPTILLGIFPDASQTRVQLLTVPPFVPAAVLVLVVAYFSDKTKMRGPYILAFLPITIVGYIILIATRDNRARYAAVFLICAGIYPSIPSILTLIANNSAGHYKRATSTAMQLVIANNAGFIATFIYDAKFGGVHGYVLPHSVVLGCLCLGWICIALNVAYCYFENAARAAGKREGNIAAYQDLVRQGKTKAPIGDRHPDFRFSL